MISRKFAACSLQSLSKVTSKYDHVSKVHPTIDVFVFKYTLFVFLGPVHMIPGQLIAPGQLTDPGVNSASVHGLTPVNVHMSFSLPWGNFERRVTRCTTPGNPPRRGNVSPCEQNAKVAPGQEQSCTCSFLMFGINFPMKSSRKHQK